MSSSFGVPCQYEKPIASTMSSEMFAPVGIRTSMYLFSISQFNIFPLSGCGKGARVAEKDGEILSFHHLAENIRYPA